MMGLASAGLVSFWYAVVSAQSEEAIELFVRREDAERFVEEVRDDEPELADLLHVGQIQLGHSGAVGPPN